jgi:hypothetical protein
MEAAAPLVRGAAALLVAAACAGAGAGSGELDAEMEEFYAGWEAAVAEEMSGLDAGARVVLQGVWPRAEFEGATADVLAILQTEPALRPMVTRLERFLQFGTSNRVRDQLQREPVDRRVWHILVDTVNRGLAGR